MTEGDRIMQECGLSWHTRAAEVARRIDAALTEVGRPVCDICAGSAILLDSKTHCLCGDGTLAGECEGLRGEARKAHAARDAGEKALAEREAQITTLREAGLAVCEHDCPHHLGETMCNRCFDLQLDLEDQLKKVIGDTADAARAFVERIQREAEPENHAPDCECRVVKRTSSPQGGK